MRGLFLCPISTETLYNGVLLSPRSLEKPSPTTLAKIDPSPATLLYTDPQIPGMTLLSACPCCLCSSHKTSSSMRALPGLPHSVLTQWVLSKHLSYGVERLL